LSPEIVSTTELLRLPKVSNVVHRDARRWTLGPNFVSELVCKYNSYDCLPVILTFARPASQISLGERWEISEESISLPIRKSRKMREYQKL
jgi:hypothetical protein